MKIKNKGYVLTEKVTGVKCDICGKTSSKEGSDGWYELMHKHEGWGNDSVDSIEYFDVCSVECYMKQLQKSIEEVGECFGAEIDEKNIEFVKKLYETLKGVNYDQTY